MALPVMILKDDVNYGQALLGWFPCVSIMVTNIYNIVTVGTYLILACGKAKG